jgi:hypothetical protein
MTVSKHLSVTCAPGLSLLCATFFRNRASEFVVMPNRQRNLLFSRAFGSRSDSAAASPRCLYAWRRQQGHKLIRQRRWLRTTTSSERPEKVQNGLFVPLRKPVESIDYGVGF